MLSDYYEPDRNFQYYRHVLKWLEFLKPTSVLDVGGRRSPILERLSPSIERVCLDIERIPGLPQGVRRITSDFMAWTPDKLYDVVVCLQVLQHIEDPKAFLQKLFQVGKTVVLCIPYQLPQGMNAGRHAMLDEKSLYKWSGRTPNATQLISDVGLFRLLAVYQSESASTSPNTK